MVSPLDAVGSPRSPCHGAYFVHAQSAHHGSSWQRNEISYSGIAALARPMDAFGRRTDTAVDRYYPVSAAYISDAFQEAV